jgi:acyl-CoA thioester hydrolase
MAKPESWRLNMHTYPFHTIMEPRYQDLDIMGHINNVAMSGIFETARIRFHHHLGRHPADRGVRWLVASVCLNFVQEAHFPKNLSIGCAIGTIGSTSWQIMSAAFQDDECVATCESVMVAKGPEARRHIDETIRLVMQENFVRQS